MNQPQFTRAVRHKAKLRIALAGPSGSGKTYSALLLAKGLGGRVAIIDTERGSASLYSHLLEYDTLEMTPPYSPERFITAIHAAEAAGYGVCIIDSITHEWNGAGGVLEIVDNITAGSRSGNKFMSWKDASPRHRAFIDALLQSNMDVIATIRTKAAYVLETGANGKQIPRKVGMEPEQRDGVEYEFTTVLDLSTERHLASASKDRSGLFGTDPFLIGPETGERLRAWLQTGTPAVPAAAQENAAPAAPNAAWGDGQIADHTAAIESAADHIALKRAFQSAWKAAGAVPDSIAQAMFKERYDTRRAALTASGHNEVKEKAHV
jgi:hypothetical protein